jgi:hypothetical protein
VFILFVKRLVTGIPSPAGPPLLGTRAD